MINNTRTCPKCGKEIIYKRKYDMITAIKRNTNCVQCSCGLSTRFKKGSKINDIYNNSENSLNELLNENVESFYWLGFLIADGCFRKNKFELGLSEKDLCHLNKFSKFIKFTKKLQYRENTKSYRLSFSDRHSVPEVMKKYGISDNKTYNPINFDYFKNYSKDLLISLLIGIIDGDGYISKNGKGHYSIIISSHKSWILFYENLYKYLELPIKIKQYNNILRIGLYKKEYIKMLNKINCPKLERKWNKIILNE